LPTKKDVHRPYGEGEEKLSSEMGAKMKKITLVIVCLAGLAVGDIQEDKKTIEFYNDSRKTAERDAIAVKKLQDKVRLQQERLEQFRFELMLERKLNDCLLSLCKTKGLAVDELIDSVEMTRFSTAFDREKLEIFYPGAMGWIDAVTVKHIIDFSDALVRIKGHPGTYWLSGVPMLGLADDLTIKVDRMFVVTGLKQYKTAEGIMKTVYAVEPFIVKDLKIKD
jgi:hypothetical protein